MRNHLETSDKKAYNSETVNDSKNSDSDDKENVCPNQSGGGKSSNNINDAEADEVTEDCNLKEEAIEENLKNIFLEATDNRKYDSLTFLKVKGETIRSIFKKERIKRKEIKIYLTLQVRFIKTKGDQVETADFISMDFVI